MKMYHKSNPWGAYFALFSGLSRTRIPVTCGVKGVWLKFNIPKSSSRADIFWLTPDLYIRFIVVVSWYKSLTQSCKEKYGLKLHNSKIKWFLNVHISCQCMFDVTNWKTIFLIKIFEWGCWKLHCRVFETMVLIIWLICCCLMFHMDWKLIFLHDFSLLLLG